jgi:hypothetical protein
LSSGNQLTDAATDIWPRRTLAHDDHLMPRLCQPALHGVGDRGSLVSSKCDPHVVKYRGDSPPAHPDGAG